MENPFKKKDKLAKLAKSANKKKYKIHLSFYSTWDT